MTETKECLNISASCRNNSYLDNSYILRHNPAPSVRIGKVYICFKREVSQVEQLREQTRHKHSPLACVSCTAVAMHTRARAAGRESVMAQFIAYVTPVGWLLPVSCSGGEERARLLCRASKHSAHAQLRVFCFAVRLLL